MKFDLEFMSSSEVPPLSLGRGGLSVRWADFLLFNQCDGFHVVEGVWLDGEFRGFRFFAQTEYIEPDFYCAWAVLPDALSCGFLDTSKRADAALMAVGVVA